MNKTPRGAMAGDCTDLPSAMIPSVNSPTPLLPLSLTPLQYRKAKVYCGENLSIMPRRQDLR